MKERKVPFQDRISYLDEVQYEANQLPGVGNYNPRVFFVLLRWGCILRAPSWRQLPKIGGRDTRRRARRNLRRVLNQPATIPNLLLTSFSRINRKWSRIEPWWEKCNDSRRLQEVQVWTRPNTTWFRSGRERIRARYWGMGWRCYRQRRLLKVFIIIDFFRQYSQE